MTRRSESFDPKVARRASAAAAPLAAWVQANVRFSRVLERIAPLENEQAKLQRLFTNVIATAHIDNTMLFTEILKMPKIT